MFKTVLMTIATVTIMAGACFGKTSVKFSLLGRVGYFQPFGEWKSHRYAPVDQFQGSYTVSPEVEVKFDDIGIGAFYSYSNMHAGDWEGFVKDQGEDLVASGSLSQLGGVIRYYFVNTERHFAHIEAGMSYVFLNGNEQYRGFDYEYDFLQSGAGFLAGAGYDYALNNRLSMTLPVRFFWKAKGIKYPEGKTYDIFGMFILPGLKLTF